ncbi:hypothetical protein CSB20_04630 [bacterium DOLZORAL124_64_63]|nr:MAG: hypothetical protein CSB20_04630 [bacterium DOLZORAL124_64_63]
MTIRIGVSSCLMGNKVRYDGGHKHNRYLTDVLGEHFTLVIVCPEAEVGMGIPRETVRLEGALDEPAMRAPGSGADWTKRMNGYARARCIELARENLSGFVFKKRSPSCGLFRVPVVQKNGHPLAKGRGLFAAEFTRRFPLIPCEEEGRLNDPHLRENFIERVFAFDRVKRVFSGRWKRGDVVAFHSREKYFLLAHSPKHYRELGRLVAGIKDHTPAAFRDMYMQLYLGALATRATTARHVNAMQHVAGHLKGEVDPDALNRIHQVIQDYKAGLVPLIVPITLLRHYIELLDVHYVKDQVYLNPHPRELMLRNHV